MSETEVFATRCWNFIGGDRHIERILRELPRHQSLVVRNRLAHVLPTVAALADLAVIDPWAPLPLSVRVPENALVERAIKLDEPVADFHASLRSRLYGIATRDAGAVAEAGDVVMVVGYTEQHEAQALADWLARQPELKLIVLAPRGARLPAPIAGLAAWSAQHFEGRSAFSLPSIEAAVIEAAPGRVWVAAPVPSVATYTAIGAVDLFIREAARHEEPDAKLLRELGGRVAVLELGEAAGPARPWREWVLAHLRDDLGVADTAADPRVRVTAEAIAIDVI